MKQVILLKKNHKIKRKNEKKLTQKDLNDSRYILTSTSILGDDHKRSFVLNSPSNYYLFTKAEINYQFCSYYQEDDMEDVMMHKPIHVTTDSLTDLLNILNSLDRIYLINQLMNSNLMDSFTGIFLVSLEIVLYQGIHEIYHIKKENIDFKVDRIFNSIEEIYFTLNTDNYKEKKHELENLRITFYPDSTWGSTDDSEYRMIGIYSIVSNSLLLLHRYEYKVFQLIELDDMSLAVYCDRKETVKKNSCLIREGKYDEMDDYFYNAPDVFHEVSGLYMGHYTMDLKDDLLLSVLFYQDFIFRFLNGIYEMIYQSGAPQEEEEYTFDTVLILNIIISTTEKQLFVNIDNIVPIFDFFASILL